VQFERLHEHTHRCGAHEGSCTAAAFTPPKGAIPCTTLRPDVLQAAAERACATSGASREGAEKKKSRAQSSTSASAVPGSSGVLAVPARYLPASRHCPHLHSRMPFQAPSAFRQGLQAALKPHIVSDVHHSATVVCLGRQ
jgi:hypothetical protein